MKSIRYLAVLGASLGLLSAPSLEAVLISTKSLGMAGIGYGYAQDGMAAAHNPGSAAALDSRYDIGLVYSHLEGEVTFDSSPVPGVNGTFDSYDKTKDFWSPYFGLIYNVDNNLTVGLVAYNRELAKTTYQRPFVILGTTSPGLEYVHQTVSPYVAYRYGCHNFGISLNWEIQRLKVDGFQNFNGASIHPGYVSNNGYNYSNGLGVTLGYYLQLTDTINVGVSYQPKTPMTRFKKYQGFVADSGKFDIPEKVGAGFSWRFLECATFAFDYEFVQWSKCPVVARNLLLPGCVGPGCIGPLGSEWGPGFGWRNKHYFRFGLDYAWSDRLTVRAGYRYAPTQIKASETVLNAFTQEPLTEHFLTGGLTWAYDCVNDVDAFIGYGFDKSLYGPNAIPVQFGGGGAKDRQNYILAIGVGLGHKF